MMILKVIKFWSGLLIVLLMNSNCHAQDNIQEAHNLVGMRTIGHEIMLSVSDSVSRVLPIQRSEGKYIIGFDTEFAFNPDDLISVVDSVVSKMRIAKSYIVEVSDCYENVILYSYEVIDGVLEDLPCKTRATPVSSYEVYFTILERGKGIELPENIDQNKPEQSTFLKVFTTFILPFALLLVFTYWYKKRGGKANVIENEHLLEIGKYEFDTLNLILSMEGEKIELTSKEANLLEVLYGSVNQTLERNEILHKVWGDEGDYIGRTLDVFISKLRKKLELDENIKIINVRGVGYKLVVNT